MTTALLSLASLFFSLVKFASITKSSCFWTIFGERRGFFSGCFIGRGY